MILALLLGFAVGFLGSVPIAGPVAIMVFESALASRARRGLQIAIGAAVAESFYALMAFWGLTTFLSRFPSLLPASKVLGALVLVALGLYFLLRKSKAKAHDHEPSKPAGTKWLLGFTVTAFNPTLLFTWTGAITALHSTGLLPNKPIDAIPFALGVGAGIICWFMLLLALVRKFRQRLSPETLDKGIRAMGVVITLAGLGVGAHVIANLR